MSYQELSKKSVKGRKEYICIWCGEKILKGEVHQVRAYKFEGDFMSDRVHIECAAAMFRINWNDQDNSFDAYEYKRGTTEQK